MGAENPVEILELLAKNEEAISGVYIEYADSYQSLSDFWRLLADEEAAHAEWLRHIYSKAQEGAIFLDVKRFKVESIKLFMKYLQERLEEARRRELPLKKALNIALDIENSLIDQKCFEIFESDQPDLKISFKRLKDAKA